MEAWRAVEITQYQPKRSKLADINTHSYTIQFQWGVGESESALGVSPPKPVSRVTVVIRTMAQ